MIKAKTEKRKSEIADKATDIFFKKDYRSTSLKDIADATGTSKAGIYHYFKTKEDILAYIFIRFQKENFTAYEDLRQKVPDPAAEPVTSLKFIIRTYTLLTLRKTKVALLSLRERHQLTGLNRENHLQEERKIFNTLKNEVSAIPGILEAYDINALVFQIISMSVWMGYWRIGDAALKREEVIEQNINIICHGVFGKI